MGNHRGRIAGTGLSLAMVMALIVPALGQRFITVPAGTIIALRMDTYSSSDSSRAGDRFTATVFRSVVVDGRVAVPENTKVEGHVTDATTTERGSKAGTLAVAFDRMVFPAGSSVQIDGTLTTLNEEGRRRIEQDVRYQEDGGRIRRAVVFIGPGDGAGETIGVPVGRTETTTLGTILGTLLGNGGKAEVRPGTEFGMTVERSFVVETVRVTGDRDVNDNDTRTPSQGVFTSAASIRFAQTTLRDRGYYTGPINGVMNQTTRNAIRRLQRDRNLSINGDLDQSTARELGIANDTGIESAAIEIMNPRAERIGAGSIRISADVHTQGAGWQVFASRFVTGNTLHVYVRGVPPRYSRDRTIDHHPFTEMYNDLPNVARVIIHGPQRDFSAELRGNEGGTAGAPSIGNPRQIALLANRLLRDFQRELNMRNNRGRVIFDTRRDFRPNEVELLFQMTSLQAGAELYNQLTASITDPDAVRGAAGGLMRQANVLERIMRRNAQLTLSSTVSADWQQLQAELARINVTDANLDTDTVR